MTESDLQCSVMGWSEMHEMARELALEVDDSDFNPDVVVALGRGGWVPARCFCDMVEENNLTSMKIEHYTGTAEKSDEPVVRYTVPESAVSGKDVLVVDDIADTGETVRRAVQELRELGADSVKTALLQELPSSDYSPDFVSEELDAFVWVIYPWNVVEDIHNLADKITETSQYDTEVLVAEFESDFGLSDEDMEKLPFSVHEVFEILEDRGVVERRTGTIFEKV